MDEFLVIDFWEMTLRTFITFLVMLVLARFLGKKQLSHLTFFNYITGITIGSIAADIAGETKTPFFNGLVSLVWWVVLTIFVGYIGLKSNKARILLDGQPTIVIKKGKILKDALKAVRLNMDDLSMMLREQQVFSVQDVHYAILEPNGELSLLKKEPQQTVTKQDLNVSVPSFIYFPSKIISDGKIVKKNLKELDLNEAWVQEELSKNGIQSVEEVFYAEIQKDGSLFINKY